MKCFDSFIYLDISVQTVLLARRRPGLQGSLTVADERDQAGIQLVHAQDELAFLFFGQLLLALQSLRLGR